MSDEVRITNPETGGQKGRKAQRFELLPWAELAQVAELYAFGASKYDDHNWRKGFAWSLSYGAMLRHASLFWEGEDYDDETGCHHLTSVVFHALALLYFNKHHRNLDDRHSTAKLREITEAQEAVQKIREVEGLKNIVESFQPYTIFDTIIENWEPPIYDIEDNFLPKKVYLCGPMTNIPKFNFPAFDRVAHRLRKRGYEVITPSELDNQETRAAALASPDGSPGSGTANGETWGDFLSRDVKLLADEPGLEAIVLMPPAVNTQGEIVTWLDSRGARLEVFCGGTLCGKRVFEYDPDRSDLGFEITDRVMTMMAEHGEPHLVPDAGKQVEDGRATAVAA